MRMERRAGTMRCYLQKWRIALWTCTGAAKKTIGTMNRRRAMRGDCDGLVELAFGVPVILAVLFALLTITHLPVSRLVQAREGLGAELTEFTVALPQFLLFPVPVALIGGLRRQRLTRLMYSRKRVWRNGSLHIVRLCFQWLFKRPRTCCRRMLHGAKQR